MPYCIGYRGQVKLFVMELCRERRLFSNSVTAVAIHILGRAVASYDEPLLIPCRNWDCVRKIGTCGKAGRRS